MVSPPYLLNLDLCILVYQLYHQTVLWPLDPWYERLARKGSDRRDIFMNTIHEVASTLGGPDYSGPGTARGWTSNKTLDPVLTNYRRINPWLPSFSRDDSRFVAVQAPDYLTSRIKKISFAKYSGQPSIQNGASTECVVNEYVEKDSGSDHLIAFEGGTGGVLTSLPAWSMMGFVLARRHADGGWDAHIVFRGSRSGSAGRAVAQGLSGHGNPDWVTDVETRNLVEEPFISKVGKVARGFSASIKTCAGPILTAMMTLRRLYGAPKQIWVTGHSLGGALAGHFTAAVTNGTFAETVRRVMPDWPWERARCMGYAMPPVGDQTFQKAFNLMADCSLIWVDGDVVVEGMHGMSTGQKIGLTIGSIALPPLGIAAAGAAVTAASLYRVGAPVCLSRPSDSTGRDNSHEAYMIRAAIIRDVRAMSPIPPAVIGRTPWAYYNSFLDMINGSAVCYEDRSGTTGRPIVSTDNLRALLTNYNFAAEFQQFLKFFDKIITNKAIYKVSWTKSDRELKARQARLQEAVTWMGRNFATPRELIEGVARQVVALSGTQGENTDRYIGLGITLSMLQSHDNVTIDMLAGNPQLKECMTHTS